MRAVLGGTFSRLHLGHKAMIDAAFNVADEVIVGLTSDKYYLENLLLDGKK